MKKFNYFFILAFSFILISCEKENNSETDFLYSKTWKIGLTDKNPSSNPNGRIIYSAPQQCNLDDTYTFKEDNNQLVINKGNEKCSATESDPETLSFSVNTSKKVLTIGNDTYTIIDFSESQIKYGMPISSGYMLFLLQ